MQGPGNHEILEHYYEQIERNTRFHCFEKNDPEGCHSLGEFLETKKRKYMEALDVYKENCLQRNYGNSCFRYGQMMFHGKGVETNLVEAYKAHERGCEVKKYNGGSCHTIGMQFMLPKVLPEIEKLRGKPNLQKALKLFVKGCEASDKLSCVDAAKLYFNGEGRHIKPQPELAFKYALKGCDLRERSGCQMVADAYKDGVGVERNEQLHEHYARLAVLMGGSQVTNYSEEKKKFMDTVKKKS